MRFPLPSSSTGGTAIIALVIEEEPAFDAAFGKFRTTIIRQYAADVMVEVELARELLVDFSTQAKERLRAERKAERQEQLEERKASFKAKLEELEGKTQARKEAFFEKGAANAAERLAEIQE